MLTTLRSDISVKMVFNFDDNIYMRKSAHFHKSITGVSRLMDRHNDKLCLLQFLRCSFHIFLPEDLLKVYNLVGCENSTERQVMRSNVEK